MTHNLSCPECGNPMVLCPTGKWGPYYRCNTYPACPGAHGAHKDGTPLGVPANNATVPQHGTHQERLQPPLDGWNVVPRPTGHSFNAVPTTPGLDPVIGATKE